MVQVGQNLSFGESVEVFFRLIILLDRSLHLFLQIFKILLIIDNFPVFLLVDHYLKLVDFSFELLLVSIDILVHLSLGVD